MYAGHIGIALGAKGLRDTVPLWVFVVASQLPDWTDAALCVASVRMPVFGMLSHSLPAVAVLAALAGSLTFAVNRQPFAAMLVAAVVISHVFADYVTGFKPTWPGGPLVGLGIYRQPAVDFAVEGTVIFGGWLLYRASFPEERRSSPRVTAVLVAAMAFQLAADIIFATTTGLRKC
ncbi:MAG: metal-dependent hydrolase [Gemmatimonadaceae bacterium]|nr:metal-dependent hydrolase [Gemmatimonadaceae bacterium]